MTNKSNPKEQRAIPGCTLADGSVLWIDESHGTVEMHLSERRLEEIWHERVYDAPLKEYVFSK